MYLLFKNIYLNNSLFSLINIYSKNKSKFNLDLFFWYIIYIFFLIFDYIGIDESILYLTSFLLIIFLFNVYLLDSIKFQINVDINIIFYSLLFNLKLILLFILNTLLLNQYLKFICYTHSWIKFNLDKFKWNFLSKNFVNFFILLVNKIIFLLKILSKKNSINKINLTKLNIMSSLNKLDIFENIRI